MIDSEVVAFFNAKKEGWLKKNIKASMSQEEVNEVKAKCEEEFALKHWLPTKSKSAGQMSISTHPCTFSHPSSRKNKNGSVTAIIASSEYKADGYLRTGNVEVQDDALGNAAAMDVYKFLTLKMEDGQPLIWHIENETDLAKTLLEQSDEDYRTIRDGFLKMKEMDSSVVTSSKIKQVFFPIEDNEYHQLSLLTASGIVFELKKRIDYIRFSEITKESKGLRRANEHCSNGYQDIFGLTTIGYGGSKPQNISVLNSANFGKAHLLQSSPPVIQQRDTRIPKSDFFKETVNPWELKQGFEGFHRLLKTDYNNLNIRDGRTYRIQEFVDHVVNISWELRQQLDSYTGELLNNLPQHQKVWLHPEKQEFRIESDEWLEALVLDVSRQFVKYYQKIIKGAVKLGDGELKAIKSIIESNKEAFR
jgi:CRISPR-associated protein Csy1